jgi:hypothetical protein
MTKAQRRYLDRIIAKPGIRFNGRAAKPVEALKRAGLITYEFELEPHAIGSWSQVYICTAAEAAKEGK